MHHLLPLNRRLSDNVYPNLPLEGLPPFLHGATYRQPQVRQQRVELIEIQLVNCGDGIGKVGNILGRVQSERAERDDWEPIPIALTVFLSHPSIIASVQHANSLVL